MKVIESWSGSMVIQMFNGRIAGLLHRAAVVCEAFVRCRVAGVRSASMVDVLRGAVCVLLLAVPIWPMRLLAGGAEFEAARRRMVDVEIAGAGIQSARILDAMRSVPRHEFVDRSQRRMAYFDMALPIGSRQTISPPFVVAYMTEQLDPQPLDRVLEIGTGSGYQAAVLSRLVNEVYTIEIVESLGRSAGRTLKRLGYDNVHTRIGDGFAGWPEAAPFDKVMVTCSPDKVPQPLVDQLKPGGRMVIPVGERYQQTLYLFIKSQDRLEQVALLPTLFVPMTGVALGGEAAAGEGAGPRIKNGDFEQVFAGEKGGVAGSGDGGAIELPAGWHYARQARLVAGQGGGRDGGRVVEFSNAEPGRGSQILQGFAVDGRGVAGIDVTVWVRGERLAPGQDDRQVPGLFVTFYDAARAMVGQAHAGPWQGTFDWRREEKRLAVPLAAREAIVRLGLLGGTGRLWLDDLQLQPAGGRSP